MPTKKPKPDAPAASPHKSAERKAAKQAKRIATRTAHLPEGMPHLLDKHQICAIANLSFPTIWAKMRAGTFPRGRVSGSGKSFWLSTEIEAWMTALPTRRLKGDAS